MFAEDAIAFGSKVEVMTSQAQLEREQWRSVWPSIEDYRFDTSTLEVVMSPDRLMAMGALIFRSTGLHPDGKKFERNGRSTVTLMRPSVGAPWICTHSHISLKPGTPGISHGKRPEKVLIMHANDTRSVSSSAGLADRSGAKAPASSRTRASSSRSTTPWSHGLAVAAAAQRDSPR